MEELDAPLLNAENSIASSSTLSKVNIRLFFVFHFVPPLNFVIHCSPDVSGQYVHLGQAKQKEITVDGSTKEKRGRKRKTRDDELPSADAENGIENNDLRDSLKKGREEKINKSEKQDKETRKFKRTPARRGPVHSAIRETPPTSSSVPFQSPSLSITPSLKIRLPRLSNLNTE